MVAAGDTVTLVPVTVPMAGEIDRLVAPVTDQLKVEAPPAVIKDGVAVKLVMAGAVCTGGVTVTFVVFVTEDVALVAVSV